MGWFVGILGLWKYFLGFVRFFFHKKVIGWVFSLTAFEAWITKQGLDGPMLSFVIFLVFMDTIGGIYVAIRLDDVSSSGFAKLFDKLFIYGGLTAIAWWAQRVYSADLKWLLYTDNALFTGFILRELLSIVEKMSKINPKLVPSFILKKLKSFDLDAYEKKINEDSSP
jgi:phage-related holin